MTKNPKMKKKRTAKIREWESSSENEMENRELLARRSSIGVGCISMRVVDQCPESVENDWAQRLGENVCLLLLRRHPHGTNESVRYGLAKLGLFLFLGYWAFWVIENAIPIVPARDINTRDLMIDPRL